MTSVLRQAFTNVKNILFPSRENEDERRDGGSNLPTSFLPLKLYSRVGIKRQHEDFEAELTEDDDDFNPQPASSKRLKSDEDISIVYYRKETSHPIAFGNRPSGSMDGEGQKNLENEAKGNLLAFRTGKKTGTEGSKEGPLLPFSKVLDSQTKFGMENETKAGNFSDNAQESKSARFSCFPNNRKEDIFKKSKGEKKKGKQFTWFNNFGFKTEVNNAIRQDEKLRYKQLLEKMNSPSPGFSKNGGLLDQVKLMRLGQPREMPTWEGGSHLTLSRTGKPLIQEICDKWTVHSSPSVVYKRSELSVPSILRPRFSPSPCTSIILPTSGIRLFSVSRSSSLQGEGPTPRRSPSSPLVIDLEKDEAENVAPPSAGPSSLSRGDAFVGEPEFSSTPAVRRRLIPSFGDLNEAEVGSDLLLQEEQNEGQDNDVIVLRDDEESINRKNEKEDSCLDEDVVILSESIVQKGRERRVNTLLLEQTSSPYPQKKWLHDLSSDWKQSEGQRKEKIKAEIETLNILRKESKIEQTLHEALRKKLMLTEIIELEEPPLTLSEITDEMRRVISSAMRPGRDSDVLGSVFNVDITRGDVRTLAPCKWLNDNIINVYMELIADRSKKGEYPNCHVFTTFFYPKYLKEGYSNALKRWTRKVDIFAHDLLIFPIHLGMHWCLAVADLRSKCLKYYDSLGGRNDKCLRSLMEYMSHEMKERKSQVLETSEWDLENVQGIPEQENGSDCGMFTCKFAECLSREADIKFIQQKNMNYYRERMIYELLNKELMFP